MFLKSGLLLWDWFFSSYGLLSSHYCVCVAFQKSWWHRWAGKYGATQGHVPSGASSTAPHQLQCGRPGGEDNGSKSKFSPNKATRKIKLLV